MDEAGFETAHIVANSLGGFVSLSSLRVDGPNPSWRSRQPAAGPPVDDSYRETLPFFATMQEQVRAAPPHAGAIICHGEGRRGATLFITETTSTSPSSYSRIRCGAWRAAAGRPMVDFGLARAMRWIRGITCPVGRVGDG